MSEATNTPKKSADEDRANHLEEWKIARNSMQFFDDKLHDLRKHGFSLVTALLATEGIVIGKLSSSVDPPVKFAVFVVTLLLILAVHLIDQNYRVSQQVINMRAVILERKLNLEMSETITDRYKFGDIQLRLQLLYGFFLASVIVLAHFSLRPDWIYTAVLGTTMLVGIVLTIRLGPSTRVHHYHGDWTMSPLKCTPGDNVTITLTNLGELFGRRGHKPIRYGPMDTIWYMKNEGSDKETPKPAGKEIEISDSYTWTLTRADFKDGPGTYQLRPHGWKYPLHRRIIVSDNTEGEKGNKELIRQAIRDTNEFGGNADKVSPWCEKYCAPGCIHHNLRQGDLSREKMTQYFQTLVFAFPDLNKSIDDMVAEGDKVIVRCTIQGTHMGTFGAITATKKHASIKGSDIYKIEAGKILEWWDFVDYLGLMTQLGAIPSTAPKT